MVAPVVSVVVPAFNAAKTIGETLRSAQQQTSDQIEIIVVDDASTDQTYDVVLSIAAQDQRIVLVRQTTNAGVAAARNRGLSMAKGCYVAPLDADDLWHPTKLQKQLAALKSDPAAGAVYTHARFIDGDGWVTGAGPRFMEDGWVFFRMVSDNLVRNGSAMLIRADLIRQVGGYCGVLRARNAEGCEDYLLQMILASRAPMAVVPEYLVAYRQHQRQMSSNTAAMLWSHLHAYEIVGSKAPPYVRWATREPRAAALVRLAGSAVRAGDIPRAFSLFGKATSLTTPASGGWLLERVLGFLQNQALGGKTCDERQTEDPRTFAQYDPLEGADEPIRDFALRARLKRAGRLDRRFSRSSAYRLGDGSQVCLETPADDPNRLGASPTLLVQS